MTETLTRDWGLKLISLILAIGLWYYAVGEEGIEITRTIPLEIKIKNDQVSLLKTSAKHIQVTLMAPRALLSEITSAEIQAIHEINEEVEAAGEYSFRLESREIKLPKPYIRVVNIEPEVVHLTLDELIVQKLAVKPHFVGEPAFGYTVIEDEIQLDPNAILVEGPKGQIQKLDAVSTDRIDLVGRIRSFRRTIPLDLPPNVKPLSEALIDVYISIREELEEKSFQDVPIKILSSSEGNHRITTDPSVVSFVLKGSVRQLERLLPENLLAYADISELEIGEHQVPVKLVLPEDVGLKEDKPVIVKVTIERK